MSGRFCLNSIEWKLLFSDLDFQILFIGWYFTTVLLTTVGYGDIVPYTKGGKLFATVYILVAGTILLHNMSMISMIPLELRRRRTELAVLNQVRILFLMIDQGIFFQFPLLRKTYILLYSIFV